MKLVTAAQMQALDRRTIAEAHVPGTVLMERAGAGVVAEAERRYGPLRGKSVIIFCGKGNNGGDGFVIARLLRRQQARVQVLLLAATKELAPDAAVMHRRFLRSAGRNAVMPFRNDERTQALLASSALVIDALLGTGLSAPVTGDYRDAIDLMNRANRPTIAVDIPSGLHADTGATLGATVQADLTVTFGLPKLGLYCGSGIDHAGAVTIVDIGIPPAMVEAVESRTLLITSRQAAAVLPSRRLAAHKGTFGHAAIIAGSVGKTGAAALAAQAALRAGTGLVTVAVPNSVNDVLEAKLLEAMTLPFPETEARSLASAGLDQLLAFVHARSAVAVGPGLSTHPDTIKLVRSLVPRLDRPCVLDADALNALAGQQLRLASGQVPPVLTPHPGEMTRLVPDLTTQAIQADRFGAARQFACEQRCILVLKGARTVVAHPDGRAMICPTGNPGMATAGTGDALTGLTVGLLAQGVSPWEAACAATYLHGLAGDLAAQELGQAGMLAGDLIAKIPHAIQTLTA